MATKRIRRRGKYYLVTFSKGKIKSFKKYRLKRKAVKKKLTAIKKKDIYHIKKKRITSIKKKDIYRIKKKKITRIKRKIKAVKKPLRKIPTLKSQVQKLKKTKIKAKSLKKLRKSDILEKISLSNVDEYNIKSPLLRKKGLLQITYKFFKFKPERKITVTARSNKLFFPREYKKGFNQCYQRALGQADFSPDFIEILSIRYIYWIPKSKAHAKKIKEMYL